MPPLARPSGSHARTGGHPYPPRPTTSASTSKPPKSKPPQSRPDTLEASTRNHVPKANKKKKRSRAHERPSTSEPLESTKPSALAFTAVSQVEDKGKTLNRLMTVPATKHGILTPAKEKQDPSPLARPPSVKPAASPLKKDDGKVVQLQKQLAKAKQEAAKTEVEMRARIEGLEREIEGHKKQAVQQDKVVDEAQQMRDALGEAVQCGVCFETLTDPHILVNWFRTPGAYFHRIHGPVTPQLDTSYRSKVCHVCRSVILRRPARVYHLRAILEPLGIDSPLPTVSQESLGADPWDNLFPEDKRAYKVWDIHDGVSRCPECLGEIEEGWCADCSFEFSASESDGDEGDWESEDGSIGDILDGDGSSEESADRRRPARGRANGFMPPPESEPRIRPLGEDEADDRLQQVLNHMNQDSAAFTGEDPSDGEVSEFEGFSNSDYGGSFIDDGELSAGSSGQESEGEGGSDEMDVDEDVVLSEGGEADSEEEVLPPIELARRRMIDLQDLRRNRVEIEELRRRRAERHAPVRLRGGDGRDNPGVRRATRRRLRPNVDLDSGDDE